MWDALVGPSRARYLLLMGYKLTAQEAREWGVVHEVLPKDQLLDRAWEIARQILRCGRPSSPGTPGTSSTQSLRRAFLNELDHGLQAEMWAQRQFFPFGAGMQGWTGRGTRSRGPTESGRPESTVTTDRKPP